MAVMGFAKKMLAGQPITLPCFRIAKPWQSLHNYSKKQQSTTWLNKAVGLAHQLPTPPSGCIPPYRDFTGVADIVSGIVAACKVTAMAAMQTVGTSTHKIYNLGKGHPESVLQLLQHLQQTLGMEANASFVEVDATTADVWVTWADTTFSRQQLDFRPQVGLQQGIHEFIVWFKSNTPFVYG